METYTLRMHSDTSSLLGLLFVHDEYPSVSVLVNPTHMLYYMSEQIKYLTT